MKQSNKMVYEKEEVNWGNVVQDKDNLLEYEKLLLKKYIKGSNKNIYEAGCGGGRLSFFTEMIADNNIDAFDYVESFIKNANISKKQMNSNINFFVADATNLSGMKDENYDYALYMQQVLCFIPRENIEKAIKESYKKLKMGGRIITTVLYYPARKANRIISLILKPLRFFRGEKDLRYNELPWLKRKGKINKSFLGKGQATVYWFEKDEIINLYKKCGFKIVECKRMGEIDGTGSTGGLCLVVEKS